MANSSTEYPSFKVKNTVIAPVSMPLNKIAIILCTAEILTIDCEDFENWFVF